MTPRIFLGHHSAQLTHIRDDDIVTNDNGNEQGEKRQEEHNEGNAQ